MLKIQEFSDLVLVMSVGVWKSCCSFGFGISHLLNQAPYFKCECLNFPFIRAVTGDL